MQCKPLPSVNWNISLSKYIRILEPNLEKYGAEYSMLQQKMKEDDLQEIVQLVGKDSLFEDQKCTLEAPKSISEDYLQHNGFLEYDYMCPLAKTIGMIKAQLPHDLLDDEHETRRTKLGEIIIEQFTVEASQDCDVVLMAVSGDFSKEFSPQTKGGPRNTTVIDNSSAFRMQADIPLVVPEINDGGSNSESGLIANPTCASHWCHVSVLIA